MADTRAQRKEMETTESYRGPVRETDNVERLYRPANDNDAYSPSHPQVTRRPPSRVPTFRPTEDRKSRIQSLLSDKISKVPNISRVVAAVKATTKIVRIGMYLYAIQVILWAINIVGLISLAAVDESWVMYLDVFGLSNIFAESLFFISMALLFIVGLCTLILAIVIYESNRPVRINISGDLSLWIAAACLTLYLAPVLSLVPWMIFWCLYVVKSQADG